MDDPLRSSCPEVFCKCDIGEHLQLYEKETLAQYLSVFSPNAGKYGPEKTPYLDTFQAVVVSIYISSHGCSLVHRKTPVSESLFNKVTG